jgi:hypothetical protein
VVVVDDEPGALRPGGEILGEELSKGPDDPLGSFGNAKPLGEARSGTGHELVHCGCDADGERRDVGGAGRCSIPPDVVSSLEPLGSEHRLAVTGGRGEHDDARVGVVK